MDPTETPPQETPADPNALAKAYEPALVEPRWYAFWEERGYFHAPNDGNRPAYIIVQPPPNVTGSLHLGHALTATIEDVLIRYKRMSGFDALWMPGIDHAGIATQMIVEKDLKKTEHKSRHDLGREAFLERVWAWKSKFGDRIKEQHKQLGASLDWERLRFTMDEQSSRAVREAFVRLFEEGLLYRAEKLINWCPQDATALSDLEVDYEEGAKGELWSFAYPLEDGTGEIVVATTRPETMLGDTAVAVHPDDERYKHLVGKRVRHPLMDRTFPIVADAILVDPAFGTGAVKVTPAHDFNDFEVGKRHSLAFINLLNKDATLNANGGKFAGLDRFEARKQVKEAIAALGLDRGTKPHVLPLGRCQRCQTVLEPLMSKQWFVKTAPLAKPAIEAVEQGRTKFVPESWTATYFHWMRNIHDWCVSRQLWWGHRIPAWYCAHGHETVARETPPACKTCGSLELTQDEDVLDTWFSSGLWPFSTLGWPEQTPALRRFYPNAVMETGFDILFFWVARMMMLGLHFMKDVPFRTVFLHAMVRDEKGEKMSKTRGNVIDPLDVTAKYGADALRFTLASMAAQGRDIKLSLARVDGYKAFANKLWNAARFALMHVERAASPAPGEAGSAGASIDKNGEREAQARAPQSNAAKWIRSRLGQVTTVVTEAIDAYRFDEAASAIYRFVWHELCDWYIELAKPALYGDDLRARDAELSTLLTTLEGALRLLHPFMPFVTEEIWQRLPKWTHRGAESLMIAPWPKADEHPRDAAAEGAMALVQEVVDAVRSLRSECNLPPNQSIERAFVAGRPELVAAVRAQAPAIALLGRVTSLEVEPGGASRKLVATTVAAGVEIVVPLVGLIDVAAERARAEKEIVRVEKELAGAESRLQNPSFADRAPAEVVDKVRAQVAELTEKRDKLHKHVTRL